MRNICCITLRCILLLFVSTGLPQGQVAAKSSLIHSIRDLFTDSVRFQDRLILSPDRDAESFAREAIEKVTQQWDVNAFLRLSHESIVNNTTTQQIDQVFFLYKKLGKLESLGGVYGSTTLIPEGTLGLFVATARFEHGDASISLQTLKQTGEWSILSLVVDSSVFRQYTTEDVTLRHDALPLSGTAVFDLLQSGDLIEIRRRKDDIKHVLLQGGVEDVERADLLAGFRNYLLAVPRDLELQLALAKLLDTAEHDESAERSMRLAFIERVSEDVAIRTAALALLGKEQYLNDIWYDHNATNRIDVLIIQLEDFDKMVAEEAALALRDRTHLDVRIWTEPIPKPQPDRRAASEFLRELFAAMSNSMTHLQLQDFIGDSHLKTGVSEEDMRAAIERYLERYAFDQSWKVAFDEQLNALSPLVSYNRTSLIEYIEKYFPYLSGNASCYIALIDDDLYDDGARFMFGGTIGPYGVVSSFQFAAPPNACLDNRPQLVERITKQLLSSVGQAIGIPRCLTPDCARAFPSSVQEHDAKSGTLCDTCNEAFEHYRADGYNPVAAGRHWIEARKVASSGAFKDALYHSSRSIELEPDNWQNYALAADLQYRSGAKQSAMDTLASSTAYIRKPEMFLTLATTAREAGDLPFAEKVYRYGHGIFPDNRSFIIGLVGVMYLQGREEAATKFLQESKTALSDQMSRFELQGDGFILMRNVTNALHAYRQAIDLGSENAMVFFNYAQCLENTGELDGALANYQESIKRNASFPDARFRAGPLLARRDGPLSALVFFEETLA